MLTERGCITYADGPLDLAPEEEVAEFRPLLQHIESVAVADVGE